MKKYKIKLILSTFYILLFVILFSCNPTTEPELIVKKDPVYIDDIFHLNIFEGPLPSDPSPHTIVNLVTDSIYWCCNFPIMVTEEYDDKTINLQIDSIYISPLCLTAMGPAKYYGELLLENGETTLNIKNGNVLNDFRLLVSDTLIHITPINSSFTQLSEQLVWRFRENSFVYSCGTMEETTWIYNDFRDSILAIESISQFYYPDSGRIPYAREPDGYYVNHPCLYFQYTSESDWETIKQKLVDYSKNTISQYSGIGIYVKNYLNDKELSWRHD